MSLTHKLARLEREVDDLVPDDCPCCQRMDRVAFSDEPQNFGSAYPYDRGGKCRLCRQPPPNVRVLTLTPMQAKAFAAIPWDSNPSQRYWQKLTLILAIQAKAADESPVAARLQSIVARHNIESVEQQLAHIFGRTQGSHAQ